MRSRNGQRTTAAVARAERAPLVLVPAGLLLLAAGLLAAALLALAAGPAAAQPATLLQDVLDESDRTDREAVPASQADVNAVAAGNNAFACDLYGRLATRPGNLFLSPFSISAALGMTWAGAREETEREMAEVLRFPFPQERLHAAWHAWRLELGTVAPKDAAAEAGEAPGEDPLAAPCTLRVANRLWPQRGYALLPAFLALTRERYGAAAQDLDYGRDPEGSRRTINLWVADQTEQKIPELIPSGVLDGSVRLVLTNAIYFLGDWQRAFPPDATRPATFFSGAKAGAAGGAAGGPEVPFMHQQGRFRHAALPDEGLDLLELPYAGGDLSMLVLLPRERDGLAALEGRLSPAGLESWLACLEERSVRVALPKFRLRSQFELAGQLRAMGMARATGAGADFSGMTGRPGLYISNVIHEAYVDVFEEGTEAAAATAVVMRKSSVPPPPVEFRADHPFLFLIRDVRSGGILFLGRLADPAGG